MAGPLPDAADKAILRVQSKVLSDGRCIHGIVSLLWQRPRAVSMRMGTAGEDATHQ